MIKTDTINKLRKLGLTSYESKCYLSLLGKDTLTVTEVSRLAGIPRTKAYESLMSIVIVVIIVIINTLMEGNFV